MKYPTGRWNMSTMDLSPRVKAQLERIVRVGPSWSARRARVVLARNDGHPVTAIARSTGLHRDSVRRTLGRFREQGLAGLRHGNCGKPRNVVFGPDVIAEIRRRALLPPPSLGEPFPTWSLYKLRDHLIRHGVVPTISHERLRQLLVTTGCSKRYWLRRNAAAALRSHSSRLSAVYKQMHHRLVAMPRSS
jgi:transposase